MSRLFYTLLFYLAIPLILLRLTIRGFKAKDYFLRWRERFGFIPDLPELATKPCIWLHTVSVGEFQAAIPLIKALQQQYPKHQLLITSMTPTGSARVRASFGEQVRHCYLPYDLPDAILRFLKHTQPKIAIILETELWPNLLYYVHQQHIPIVLANARLSKRSCQGYQRFLKLMQPAVIAIDQIVAQADLDQQHFLQLGAKASQITVSGNIKFDLQLADDLLEQATELRQQWGAQRKVFIAASTHEGEDEIILQAFAEIKKNMPMVLLVLVPRHPERFNKVAELCRCQGYQVIQRSQNQACTDETDIFVGDTMGELMVFYAASDVVFVGGSLKPIGGHNPLEPASLAKPIFFGSHMFNFLSIAQLMLKQKAAVEVSSAQDLAEKVLSVLYYPDLAKQQGALAVQIVLDNKGALDKLLGVIGAYLMPKK